MNLRAKITLALLALISLPGLFLILLTTNNTTSTSEKQIAREIENAALPLLATGNIQSIDTLLADTKKAHPELANARITLGKTNAPAQAKNENTYALHDIGTIHLTSRQNTQTTTILTFFIISLGITAIASLFITTRLLNPLKTLSNTAHELSLGNYNTKATITSGDELQTLAEILNKTGETLTRTDSERKQIDSAKTRFLSITSHELRSPMTPMKAQLQMLEQGYFGPLNTKQKNSITMVIRNADRLDTLIADFLEISRIEAARLKFTFRKANLSSTLRETVKYMNGFMPEKKITLKTNLAKLPTIETDPDRIAQVLRNLISNAIKFSPQNAEVTITAKPDGDTLHFTVQDEGIGIAPKDQLKLFEPFFQAEQTMYREGKGVGLGLAICRGIVLSQNGKIWIESKPGKGTTIHFTIPLKPVRDIKPIRVLFSSKEQTEKKLRQLFTKYLGPIGQSEFSDLEDKLTTEHLTKYADDLHARSIIDKQLAQEFKHQIQHILNGTEGERK